MAILVPEPIVDIEDIVIILIVIAVIVGWFARFCEDAPWIVC